MIFAQDNSDYDGDYDGDSGNFEAIRVKQVFLIFGKIL
jgi:hypothetical protein